MEKILEKYLPFVPMIFLLVIIIGFFVSEWTGALPVAQLNSFLLLGQDKSIKLLG